MKLFRISNILYMVCTAALATLLFWVSQNVQHAEQNLHAAQKKLASEQNTLQTLEVEWHYLTRPQRLEQLARERLDMGASESDAVLESSDHIPSLEIPVLPGIKPAHFKTQPKPASVSKPAPSPMPEENDRARFNALIETLSEEGGTP